MPDVEFSSRDEAELRRLLKKRDQAKRQKDADMITTTTPTIESTIKAAIHEQGLPILEIAKRSGVDQSQAFSFVRAERSLSLDSLEKLCNYLGLTLTKKTGTHD